QGPASIRTENAQLAAYIFVDLRDRDLGGYVAEAQKAVAAGVKFPPGTYVTWSGQFEYLERAEARLKVVVPVTLLIIFLLLYLNFRTFSETLIVMLSVPFALVGGLWLLWWLGFNLSVAVAVGFIALAGVAAETGVVMLIYLDHALKDLQARRAAEGRAFRRDAAVAACRRTPFAANGDPIVCLRCLAQRHARERTQNHERIGCAVSLALFEILPRLPHRVRDVREAKDAGTSRERKSIERGGF